MAKANQEGENAKVNSIIENLQSFDDKSKARVESTILKLMNKRIEEISKLIDKDKKNIDARHTINKNPKKKSKIKPVESLFEKKVTTNTDGFDRRTTSNPTADFENKINEFNKTKDFAKKYEKFTELSKLAEKHQSYKSYKYKTNEPFAPNTPLGHKEPKVQLAGARYIKLATEEVNTKFSQLYAKERGKATNLFDKENDNDITKQVKENIRQRKQILKDNKIKINIGNSTGVETTAGEIGDKLRKSLIGKAASAIKRKFSPKQKGMAIE